MNEPGPILFLDIDDVLCLSHPYGGFAVIHAVKGLHATPDEVFARVFTAEAKAALERLDVALDRRLRYVISSNWRQSFERAEMATVFQRAGLPFVAERLEPGDRWRTPFLGGGDRAGEILRWLRQHHQGEPYAMVDDEFSGFSLLDAVDHSAPQFVGRLVVCEEGVGLLDRHVPELLAAFQGQGGVR